MITGGTMYGLTMTETIIAGIISVIVGGFILKSYKIFWLKIKRMYWIVTNDRRSWELKTSLEKIKSGLKKENRWWMKMEKIN